MQPSPAPAAQFPSAHLCQCSSPVPLKVGQESGLWPVARLHYTAVQLTALHCSTLQYSPVDMSAVDYSALHCTVGVLLETTNERS